MGGLGSNMVDLARVGVPEQQLGNSVTRLLQSRRPALVGARWPLRGFDLARAVEVGHRRTEGR